MLIIVNPYATTVSDRLRHLVVYALQGRFEVDAVDTQGRAALGRQPATQGALRRLLLHLGRRQDVHAALPGPAPPPAGPGGRTDARGRHGDRAERLTVHLLPEPSNRDRRGRRPELGHA